MYLYLTVGQGWIVYISACWSQGRSSSRNPGTHSESSVWIWFPVCCQRLSCMLAAQYFVAFIKAAKLRTGLVIGFHLRRSVRLLGNCFSMLSYLWCTLGPLYKFQHWAWVDPKGEVR